MINLILQALSITNLKDVISQQCVLLWLNEKVCFSYNIIFLLEIIN